MTISGKSNSLFLLLLFCSLLTKSFAQSGLDLSLLRSANPRYPTNLYFKAFSSTAKPISVAIPFGMLAYALIDNNKKLEANAYEAAASIAIAMVATEALKTVVKRQRPYFKHDDVYPDFIDNSNSFPSGHTSVAFAAATSVTLTSKKWYIAVPAFAWASGVGYSRIYEGQHYPSDVLAGAIVGAGSAVAAHWLNKKLFRKKK
ncbi:MAG: phosphatase PAP2 family protein [Bacteroidota bacterium]